MNTVKIKVILFDLDGTLTDPMVGITSSVQYALRKFDIIEDNLWNLTPFIGPPLTDSFMRFYSFTKEQAQQAVSYYREYFAPKGKFENEVYEGIPEMLADLKEAGYFLAVATSKPEVFARDILEHFELMKYFDFVGGALLDGRFDKAEVIAYVLEHVPAKREEIVMVGDREHDIIGAKKNQLHSIGVLYGYGDEEEHKKAGADDIVATVEELRRYFLVDSH